MSLIKTLGLTVSALVVMIFMGAPSAFANGSTVLCKVNETPCAALNVYTGHIEALAENPLLLATFFGFPATLQCDHLLISGTALGLGSPQVIHIELLDATGNCKTGLGASCTVQAASLGLLDLLRTAANLGVATSLKNEIRILCGGFPSVDCSLAGEPVLHVTDSSSGTPHLTASKANLKALAGGTNCPSDPLWDVLYKITLPLPLFIST